MSKKRIVIVAPGRGSYARENIGVLNEYSSSIKDQLSFIDSKRRLLKKITITELDKQGFKSNVHMVGENAAPLIYSCSLADFYSIDRDKYEIVAGERRWRATQIAGLESIPAIVKDISDEVAIVMALIENIQREDLNAIEESRALIRLQNEFELTQQQVASAVGKSRSAVTNLMRLASLEPSVQDQLEQGKIELGHAKCLLAVSGNLQISLAKDVAEKGLSVRQTENLIKQLRPKNNTALRPSRVTDPDIVRIQEELSEKVGAQVEIHHSPKGSGKLTVKYHSLDELDGILDHIN